MCEDPPSESFGFSKDSETNLRLQVFSTSIRCSVDIMTGGFVDDSSGRVERSTKARSLMRGFVRSPCIPIVLCCALPLTMIRDTVILLA